jgi:hypothetical protein
MNISQQQQISLEIARTTYFLYNSLDRQQLSGKEWQDRIAYLFLVKKDMYFQNQGRSQQCLNSPANMIATVMRYSTAHICDAEG